jgi:hypothetical protein
MTERLLPKFLTYFANESFYFQWGGLFHLWKYAKLADRDIYSLDTPCGHSLRFTGRDLRYSLWISERLRTNTHRETLVKHSLESAGMTWYRRETRKDLWHIVQTKGHRSPKEAKEGLCSVNPKRLSQKITAKNKRLNVCKECVLIWAMGGKPPEDQLQEAFHKGGFDGFFKKADELSL